jgi:hypothetical protein
MTKRNRSAVLYTIAVLLALGACSSAARAAEPMLAHMVFFQLNEPTDEGRARLVEACKEYLAGHRGTVHFSAGVIAADMNRDVNDREFDVALHVVFKNKKAHDVYQNHPRHLTFIEKHKASWKKVRVFDSYVTPLPRTARPKPEADRKTMRIALPDPAAAFAGMIRGEVASRQRNGVVVVVKEILKEWEHNKAEDATSLIGKRVLVVPNKAQGDDARNLIRFLRSLKPNEVVSLDVAHREGEALTLLELTDEQRQRVAQQRRPKKKK